MSATAKLTGFAAVLAVVFAAALGFGSAVDPDAPVSEADAGGHADAMSMARGEHGAATPVRGLASSESGLSLVVDDPDLPAGRNDELAFRVVDESGSPVREFEVEHTKRMHMIVVRRDLTGFQHLHPRDGAVTARGRPGWTLPEAGSYLPLRRLRSNDGEPVTLASDLRVDGDADLRPLPPPSTTATADGYDVRLAGAERRMPGERAKLGFEGRTSTARRSRDSSPTWEPTGHLVVASRGGSRLPARPPVRARGHRWGRRRHQLRGPPCRPPAATGCSSSSGMPGRVHTAEFTEEVGQP